MRGEPDAGAHPLGGGAVLVQVGDRLLQEGQPFSPVPVLGQGLAEQAEDPVPVGVELCGSVVVGSGPVVLDGCCVVPVHVVEPSFGFRASAPGPGRQFDADGELVETAPGSPGLFLAPGAAPLLSLVEEVLPGVGERFRQRLR